MLFTVLFAKLLLLRTYGSLTHGLSSSGYFIISKNKQTKRQKTGPGHLFSTQKKLQDVVVAVARSLECLEVHFHHHHGPMLSTNLRGYLQRHCSEGGEWGRNDKLEAGSSLPVG